MKRLNVSPALSMPLRLRSVSEIDARRKRCSETTAAGSRKYSPADLPRLRPAWRRRTRSHSIERVSHRTLVVGCVQRELYRSGGGGSAIGPRRCPAAAGVQANDDPESDRRAIRMARSLDPLIRGSKLYKTEVEGFFVGCLLAYPERIGAGVKLVALDHHFQRDRRGGVLAVQRGDRVDFLFCSSRSSATL